MPQHECTAASQPRTATTALYFYVFFFIWFFSSTSDNNVRMDLISHNKPMQNGAGDGQIVGNILDSFIEIRCSCATSIILMSV